MEKINELSIYNSDNYKSLDLRTRYTDPDSDGTHWVPDWKETGTGYATETWFCMSCMLLLFVIPGAYSGKKRAVPPPLEFSGICPLSPKIVTRGGKNSKKKGIWDEEKNGKLAKCDKFTKCWTFLWSGEGGIPDSPPPLTWFLNTPLRNPYILDNLFNYTSSHIHRFF